MPCLETISVSFYATRYLDLHLEMSMDLDKETLRSSPCFDRTTRHLASLFRRSHNIFLLEFYKVKGDTVHHFSWNFWFQLWLSCQAEFWIRFCHKLFWSCHLFALAAVICQCTFCHQAVQGNGVPVQNKRWSERKHVFTMDVDEKKYFNEPKQP